MNEVSFKKKLYYMNEVCIWTWNVKKL